MITKLEGGTAPQMEKVRSGVWSQNRVSRPQVWEGKLCPEPHMPPADMSLGSTGVMFMVLVSCPVLFELTEKLTLGTRLAPHPISDHAYLPQCSPRPLVCRQLPLPSSVTGREDSNPKDLKCCARENSWKVTISNGGGYHY